MVEVNKFESMTPEDLQDRMFHHMAEGTEAKVIEKNPRKARAHYGWYTRLDEIYFRRFSMSGMEAIDTPEFRRRRAMRTSLEVR